MFSVDFIEGHTHTTRIESSSLDDPDQDFQDHEMEDSDHESDSVDGPPPPIVQTTTQRTQISQQRIPSQEANEFQTSDVTSSTEITAMEPEDEETVILPAVNFPSPIPPRNNILPVDDAPRSMLHVTIRDASYATFYSILYYASSQIVTLSSISDRSLHSYTQIRSTSHLPRAPLSLGHRRRPHGAPRQVSPHRLTRRLIRTLDNRGKNGYTIFSSSIQVGLYVLPRLAIV